MHAAMDRLLVRAGGVASHARLVSVSSRNEVDHEIRTGRLVRVHPDAYCRPWDADLEPIRHRAALISVGLPVALSHLTALTRWGLPVIAGGPVHVVVPTRRRLALRPDIVVHRVTRFPPVRKLDGLPTVSAAAAIVQSWQLLGPVAGRAPMIEACRERVATTHDIRVELDRANRLRARRSARDLLQLIESGCESELEIWGLLHVFDAPGLRGAVRQKTLRVGGRRYRIDIAYESERVAVELDGFRSHGTRAQRERDARRDAALASIGWITLRFSYDRLTNDPGGCRRDVLATLATRRRRSGSG